MSQGMEEYVNELRQKIDEIYEIAKKARSLGCDPELGPEIPRAGDLAERVEKLVGPPGVAEVIRELDKVMPREELALKLVDMIVDGKFGKMNEQAAAEQAIRTTLAVLTEGIVIAPIEGITHVEIRKNFDGSPYLALYFASPIRAAGGTAAALAVLAGDFVRRRLYLSPYKPDKKEIERFVEEVEIYRTSIAHEQYTPSPEDIRFTVENLPVEITGEPTERDITVTAFRDLERIGHNLVRGGAVLALTEGVMQKAPKILKHVNKLNIDGWGWLSDLVSKVPASDKTAPVFPKGDIYLSEVIAGRPVFSHPGMEGHRGRDGGFRLRYGRARNTGIAAVGVHPATMVICDDFIAVGTQLKTERPGKGGAVTPVDSIEGPIVKLKDGSVVRVSSAEEALELRDRVEEILFLGDILIGFGEFLENNHPLMPAGYCLPDFEKVLVRIDGKLNLVTIGDLVEEELKNEVSLNQEVIWAQPKRQIEVVAFDSDTFELTYAPVSKILKKKGGPVLRIITEGGRISHVSPDHPMLVASPIGFRIQPAGSIRIGDYLPISKSIPLSSKSAKEIDLIDEFIRLGYQDKIVVEGVKSILSRYERPSLASLLSVSSKEIDRWRMNDRMPLRYYISLEEDKSQRANLRLRLVHSKKSVPAIIKVNSELARLIGYYLSEGTITDVPKKSYSVRFTFGAHENELCEEAQKLIQSVFGARPTLWRGKGTIHVQLYGRIFSIVVEKILNMGGSARTKKIPSMAFSLSRELIAELLHTYFMGDGSAYMVQKKWPAIRCTTVSSDLAYGVHYLLLLCSISSNISVNKTRKSYQLDISAGKSMELFSQLLPRFTHKKGAIYKKTRQASYLETIPTELLGDGGEGPICAGWKETLAFKRQKRVGKEIVQKCGNTFAKKILNSEIALARVEKIEKVEYDGYYYDFEIQEKSAPHGVFLHGFGVFSHNCEEWWSQEVKRVSENKKFGSDLSRYLSRPYPAPPPSLAIRISEELGVPLHPAYTYPYHDLRIEELAELGGWLVGGEPEFEDGELKRLRLPLSQTPKRVLEELGVPHRVEGEQVIIEDHVLPLCKCLGLLDGQRLTKKKLEEVLRSGSAKETMEIIQTLAGFPVRKKAPTRIGARMGRPEKANPRQMKPPVHVLFPVGMRGGMTRSLIKAAKGGETYVEVANLECPRCKSISFTRKCQKCGATAEFVKTCPKCGRPVANDRCPVCNVRVEYFSKRALDLKSLFEAALERLQEKPPELVKGVQGMTSAYKIPEPIEKGILRAKHGVYVFKDGTIRFDATDVPLTHFRPREIGTTVERLRELGYTKDIHGNPLESEDQLLELKVQDVIISSAGAEYLFRASKFVDELLQKLYGLPPYYSATQPADLVGHIVMGLAPHTSVGIAGRIIGFTDATVGYAHPFFHAAKRRDCDGDEDCVMLLLDALLNFSRRFLPSKRGGTMDAPLIFSTSINPAEIDKEAHNMDVMERYPIEFYEATQRYASPVEAAKMMETVERRLGKEAQYEGLKFSFDTSDIAAGPHSSRYKTLETMEEKTSAQLDLAKKIRAVDERDVAERLIEHHFIPDLKGNIRTFASQDFRCVACNSIHRRVPLSGVCTRCGGKLVLTVTRGGVEKYLQIAMRVADDYHVSEYTKQRLGLAQDDIKSMFESDARRQLSLADFL